MPSLASAIILVEPSPSYLGARFSAAILVVLISFGSLDGLYAYCGACFLTFEKTG